MDRTQIDIGKAIAYYRKKVGLSQEELADRLYLSRNSVSDLENNKTVLSVERAFAISEILDVLPEMFISRCKMDEEKIDIQQALCELECIEDEELIGMVISFIKMLSNSSYNKKRSSE